MYRLLCAALLSILLLPHMATAQDRVRLGYGRLIVNDFIGDGHDRWRSGSFTSSRVWGRGWNGHLPSRFGDVIELRLGAEILAPDNLTTPAAGDRRYGTALSLGLHSHYMRQQIEVALGADMVVTGPQTGLGRLQGAFHDVLGTAGPSAAVRGAQIANGFHPTAVVEMGRTVSLGTNTRLRPFVEGRAGAETLLRTGFDMTFGQIGANELMVRDPVSGQRYRTMQLSDGGYTFVLGADIAKVSRSIFLPAPAYTLTDTRQRLRAGVHWQGKHSSGFYGLSWLGEEFVGQGNAQVVGAMRLNFNF